MPQYRITGGPSGSAALDYKSKRAEVGDVVDDLPRESIKWLRDQGYIEVMGKDSTDSSLSDPVDPPAVLPATDGVVAPEPAPEAADHVTNVED